MSASKIDQATSLHVILQILILLLLPCSTIGFGYAKRPTEIKKWEHAIVPFKLSTTFCTHIIYLQFKVLITIIIILCENIQLKYNHKNKLPI